MKVDRITTRGLKGRDHDLTLSPVTLILGPNGCGKTEVLQALHLLARGHVPEIPATPDGVMRLARGDTLEVSAVLDTGQRVARRWTRDAKGKVTVSGELGGVAGLSATAVTGAITAQLGQWAESWRPDDLLGASAAKMRSRLIELLGAADVEIPDGLGPSGVSVDEWLTGAKARVSRAREAADAELKRLRAALTLTEQVAVPDEAPVIQALERLRAELADAQVLADIDRDLAAAEREASATLDGPSVAEAHEALAQARMLRDERGDMVANAAHAAKAVDAAAVTIRGYMRRGCTETADLVDVDDAEQASASAQNEAAATKRAEEQAGAAVSAAFARHAALTVDVPIGHCPACNHDLSHALAAARAIAKAALDDANSAQRAVRNAAAQARKAVEATERVRERVKLGSQAREILARTWEMVEDEARATRGLTRLGISGADLEAAVHRAQADVLTAETRATMRSRAEAAKARAIELRERRESIPEARPFAQVEAEIRARQRELVDLGAARARAAERETAKAELEAAEEAAATARRRVARVREVEAQILDAVRARLEAPLSAACGAPVSVVLEDARGNPTCRVMRGGLDVASISTGERLRFVGALLVVLGRLSAAPWKPVLIDGLESISAGHRVGFLAMLRDAVYSGAISQAIIAGCPDSAPVVDGVDVTDLGFLVETA